MALNYGPKDASAVGPGFLFSLKGGAGEACLKGSSAGSAGFTSLKP